MGSKVTKTSNRTRISEEWSPSSGDIEFAKGLGIDPVAIADSFRDYHLAHGSLMASWPAAWRTWCRNQVKFSGRAKQRNLPLLAVIDAPDPADPYGAKRWAAALHDSKPETVNGVLVPCIEGVDAAGMAVDCCQAAGLPPEWRGDLTHIAEWLRGGIDPDHILAVVRGSRPPRTPGAWWWYEEKVRGRRIQG